MWNKACMGVIWPYILIPLVYESCYALVGAFYGVCVLGRVLVVVCICHIVGSFTFLKLISVFIQERD